MNVLGIDPSLTGTGFSYRNAEGVVTGTISPGKLRGAARLCYLRDRFLSVLSATPIDLVVYEGYSMNSKFGRLADLGELGGVLKVAMHDRSVPYLIVPPSNLKMFATGNGGLRGDAGKKIMAQAAADHLGRTLPTYDEADAFFLMLLGEAWVFPRTRPRDRRHYRNRALLKCEMFQRGVHVA